MSEHVEWAAIDNGRYIVVEGATCPADVIASAHGHGNHGPIGVAKRVVHVGEWEELT